MEKFKRLSFRSTLRHPDIVDQLQALAVEIGERSINSLVERFLLEGIAREQAKMAPQKEELPKKVSYIDVLLSDWYALYEKSRGSKYLNQYTGKDRKAMGGLLNKHKQEVPGSDSDQTRRSFRVFFEACLNIRDNWYYHNMDVTTMLSKLDNINSMLRKNDKPRKVTSEDIDRIVNNR